LAPQGLRLSHDPRPSHGLDLERLLHRPPTRSRRRDTEGRLVHARRAAPRSALERSDPPLRPTARRLTRALSVLFLSRPGPLPFARAPPHDSLRRGPGYPAPVTTAIAATDFVTIRHVTRSCKPSRLFR